MHIHIYSYIYTRKHLYMCIYIYISYTLCADACQWSEINATASMYGQLGHDCEG